MTAHVFNNFIQPLAAAFRIESSDPRLFCDGLAKELSCYTEISLRNAADEIRRSRRYPTFPTIAECIQACDRVPNGRPSEKVPADYRRSDEMPILGIARKYVADYEAAGSKLRAHYDRIMPDRYIQSKAMVRDYCGSIETDRGSIRTAAEQDAMRKRIETLTAAYR